MLFNSVQYAAFLAVVIALYWLLPRPARRWLILVASYLFYAAFDWRFCGVLAFVTVAHFLCGLGAARARTRDGARLSLALGIATTLGVLVVLKYLGFFVGSFADMLGTFGFDVNPATLAVVVPWGVSFYTLHSLSYVIDVYRRELAPTRSLLTFALFVSYFPQLLAGPLTRGKRMFPQFDDLPVAPSRTKWTEGLELILIGLFQKVAVADALASFTSAAFVDTTSGPAPARNWLMLIVAAFAGVVQFVLDFAGYSNIARGSSKLLGIELPYNFRQPLTRSRDFQDYWRRHNMTLMAWFRDYIFRPLRRRSDTVLRSSLVIVFVFMVSGLWHGASWGWVLWGVFIGGVVAIEIDVKRRREARRRARVQAAAATSGGGSRSTAVAVRPASRPSTAARRVGRQLVASFYCIGVLALSMVFFRSPTLHAAGGFYREVLSFRWSSMDWDSLLLFAYAIAAVIVIDGREHRLEVSEGTLDRPTVSRALLWGVMVLLIVVFSGTASPQPFVYFQF